MSNKIIELQGEIARADREVERFVLQIYSIRTKTATSKSGEKINHQLKVVESLSIRLKKSMSRLLTGRIYALLPDEENHILGLEYMRRRDLQTGGSDDRHEKPNGITKP